VLGSSADTMRRLFVLAGTVLAKKLGQICVAYGMRGLSKESKEEKLKPLRAYLLELLREQDEVQFILAIRINVPVTFHARCDPPTSSFYPRLFLCYPLRPLSSRSAYPMTLCSSLGQMWQLLSNHSMISFVPHRVRRFLSGPWIDYLPMISPASTGSASWSGQQAR
jgi:hypothetical protein